MATKNPVYTETKKQLKQVEVLLRELKELEQRLSYMMSYESSMNLIIKQENKVGCRIEDIQLYLRDIADDLKSNKTYTKDFIKFVPRGTLKQNKQ